MTKNQLIKKLQNIKGNQEILISSDSEGNQFNHLYEICEPNEELELNNGTTISNVIILFPN